MTTTTTVTLIHADTNETRTVPVLTLNRDAARRDVANFPNRLPFCDFGYSGGFGLERDLLVRAVRAENWDEASRLFTTLVEQSADELFESDSLDYERAVMRIDTIEAARASIIAEAFAQHYIGE